MTDANLIFAYTSREADEAIKNGAIFLGVSFDPNTEVHVFLRKDASFPEQHRDRIVGVSLQYKNQEEPKAMSATTSPSFKELMEMNIEQLKAMQEAINSEIAKQEATLKPWPQEDDKCWCLPMDGFRYPGTWNGTEFDKQVLAQGNIFSTEAEAIAERDARAVVVELRRQPGVTRFVVGGNNYSIKVDLEDDLIYMSLPWCEYDGGWHSIYFSSREAAQAAVQAVGKARILKAARWWAMREV